MFWLLKIFEKDSNKNNISHSIIDTDDYIINELNRIWNIKDETIIPKNYIKEIKKILNKTMNEFKKKDKDYELLIQYEGLLIKLRKQIQDRIKQLKEEKNNRHTIYKINKSIRELDNLQKEVRDVVSYMSKELHSYQIKQTKEKNKNRNFWEVDI